jgi:hypothetical protein
VLHECIIPWCGYGGRGRIDCVIARWREHRTRAYVNWLGWVHRLSSILQKIGVIGCGEGAMIKLAHVGVVPVRVTGRRRLRVGERGRNNQCGEQRRTAQQPGGPAWND